MSGDPSPTCMHKGGKSSTQNLLQALIHSMTHTFSLVQKLHKKQARIRTMKYAQEKQEHISQEDLNIFPYGKRVHFLVFFLIGTQRHELLHWRHQPHHAPN